MRSIVEQKTTKVKFLKEIEAEISNYDGELGEDENLMSLSLFECCSCHWRFIGVVERYGYGYDSEGRQTPDYCPVCGRKIEDEFAK